MYREGIEQLRKWKDSRRRKPLMITGVRQCGKTYLIKQFAEQYFEQYVYLNFEEEERKRIVSGCLPNKTGILARDARHASILL